MTKIVRLASLLLLLAATAFLAEGCAFDLGSSDSGGSAPAATASSPSTATGFSQQFLASSPDNAEPKDVSSLDLSGLPESETQFDSKLGN